MHDPNPSHAKLCEEVTRLRNVHLNWRKIHEAVDSRLAVRERPSAVQLAVFAEVVNAQLEKTLKA